MASDPINTIKDQLDDAKRDCETLREAINSSDQNKASMQLLNLQGKLTQIREKLQSEFGWMLPSQEE
jgi:hypothetical protein